MKSTNNDLNLLIWMLTIILIVWSFEFFFQKCYGAALVTEIITIGFLSKLKGGK